MDEDMQRTMKQITDLAHYGGLAMLSEADALVAIRRLTLKYWDKKRTIDAATLDTLAAVRASKAVVT